MCVCMRMHKDKRTSSVTSAASILTFFFLSSSALVFFTLSPCIALSRALLSTSFFAPLEVSGASLSEERAAAPVRSEGALGVAAPSWTSGGWGSAVGCGCVCVGVCVVLCMHRSTELAMGVSGQ